MLQQVVHNMSVLTEFLHSAAQFCPLSVASVVGTSTIVLHVCAPVVDVD